MSRRTRTLSVLLIALCFGLSAMAANYTLTITVQGNGTTSPAPGSYSYPRGTMVTVTAIPNTMALFDRWSGASTATTNPVTVKVDKNKTLTANFLPITGENALRSWVTKPDPNYSWNQYHSSIQLGYTTYFIKMNSQQWRSTSEVDRNIWWHHVIIHKGWFTGDTAVMMVSGGSNGTTDPTSPDADIGTLSFLTGIPVCEVKQIPNQPLYFADEGGLARSEDDLIAYSFDKAMDTGDLYWTAYLPMVKAVVRGMDTVQAKFSSITHFILAGASKRGWTTWLTAAYNDPRLIAYAPMVIDILNIDAQVDHHWDSYGFYAPAMDSYVAFDLFCRMKDPAAYPLLRTIDPYLYVGASSAYNLPKCIVGSSGDQFFLPDAMQYYMPAIGGSNHVRYVPNTDHTLEQNSSVINGIAAWAQEMNDGATGPVYSWTVEPDRSLRVVSTTTPSQVLLWQATNPLARDFRLEAVGPIWTSSVLTNQGGGVYVGSVPQPAQGWTAYFVELTYPSDHVYTTEILVTPDVEPFDGTHCMP